MKMLLEHVLVLFLCSLAKLTSASLLESGDSLMDQRYICGGHSGILIASGTNFRVTPSLGDLVNSTGLLVRKTRWISRHARTLIEKYYDNQRVHEGQPDITDPPSCLHMFQADQSMDIQSDLKVLSKVVGVLSRMKVEEDEYEHGYMSTRLQSVQSAVEQLMCQQFIFLGMLNRPLPSRNIITTVSKWCQATCTASRYERDFFLLKRIKLLVDNLHDKYKPLHEGYKLLENGNLS